MDELGQRIAQARGDEPADLVLRGAQVFELITDDMLSAEYDKFNKTQRIESDFDKAVKQIEASKKKGGDHE